MSAPFRLEDPAETVSCMVVASPHSGRRYGAAFLRASVLDERAIRSSEDAFVDRLVADAPALGVPLLMAEYPRAYLDLNRAEDELDPAVIDGVPRVAPSPRINSGLGVIPRVVANGRAIYRGKLPRAEAEARITAIWRPYHAELTRLMNRARAAYGQAVLLDMHSMPHEALDAVSKPGGPRPEIVLGDRFGASATGEIVDLVETAFLEVGFTVSRNAPFAGAYITQRYGQPHRGLNAVQVEIDRALYMNEAQIRPNARFAQTQARIGQALTRIVSGLPGRLPLVAE